MDDDKEFEEWLSDMDIIFRKVFWLSYQDFPDWGWRDAFDDGMSPSEAVEAYREEMDF
jgi:Family of unknown function (DUF5419)